MSLYNKIIDQQKLQDAWRQVYKNKPKEGVDHVTYEEFEEDKKNRIKSLWSELVNHTYECQPVQLIPIYKGDKMRCISLYTMRDKVLQSSMAREISSIFEPYFSECCYAYRSGKSALHASQKIHHQILQMRQGYVLRADISSFFDCILHDVLISKIREKVHEKDVVELILKVIKTCSLEKTGELIEKKRGVYQGSTLAPVLSNIYLMKMDSRIERETVFYIRYSDDILAFFEDAEKAETYRKQLSLYLEELGLELNEKKTRIVSFDEGFEFLGYQFDQKGKAIPKKAEDQLAERLEDVWLDSKYHTIQTRLEKGAEILNGWEQYFTEERQISSILEYVVWVFQMEKKDTLDTEKMEEVRKKFDNPYKDVTMYLAEICNKKQLRRQELREYEQFFAISELNPEIHIEENHPLLSELLDAYARFIVQETDDVRAELIQLYSDLKMYQKAEVLLDGMKSDRKSSENIRLIAPESETNTTVMLTPKELSLYMDLFVGREDLYALGGITAEQKRKNEEVLQPLLMDVVKRHLEQKETVSTYIQRNNGTVKYLVLDLDISKGILLQCKSESIREEYMSKCFQIAVGILKELRHMGISGYLEQSGCRGYHIWIFFSEWLPVRYANLLSDIIEQKTGDLWRESGIQVEYFPNKTRIKNGKKGQCLKLPWGVHPRTGKISSFLNMDFQYYEPQKLILDEIIKHSGNTIKKIIAANKINTSYEQGHEYTEVDHDLKGFGSICDSVRTVLDSCNLLRYLCQKSRNTHYLNHFERLTVLYVFGHLGEEGKTFIHKVMSFTLNYSYQTTQKFILRCPEKPVSCLKLREQYKQISAEIGCSCNFKRTKNCYPSPVLHALKNAEENNQITMPVSKTIPVNKQNELKEEINVSAKAQMIAEKMMELRKQRRNLDKALRKYEQELSDIFDDGNTDNMEIKMGLLVRRRNGEKTEWVIEL